MAGSEEDPGAASRPDAAVAIARAILDVVAPCLRPEERRDAFEEFYRVADAGLEAYEASVRAAGARLRPSAN
jgi:hypothetical protein